MILKNCKYIITQDANRSVLEDQDILIEGNRIVEMGRDISGAIEIDCSERLVMPGLINAHTHLGMTLMRGISDDKELEEWLSLVWKVEADMDDDQISDAVELGIRESLSYGTTTVFDMFYKQGLAAKRADELGIRFIGAQGLTSGNELSPKEISLPASISERIAFALGPHAILSTTEEQLRDITRISQDTGCLVSIHLAETRRERANIKEDMGILPIEYLDRIGFLNDKVLLVHCNWLTKGELDVIAKRGCSVVHCPQSNMKLAGGSAMPLREMCERGINVCLGTDSAVSNNSLDMFREMHTAALLHKHHYWDPKAADAQTVLDMATLSAAKALRLDAGSIEPGKLADIIALDITHPGLLPIDRDRVISHVVYAACGPHVSEVIIDGKLLHKKK